MSRHQQYLSNQNSYELGNASIQDDEGGSSVFKLSKIFTSSLEGLIPSQSPENDPEIDAEFVSDNMKKIRKDIKEFQELPEDPGTYFHEDTRRYCEEVKRVANENMDTFAKKRESALNKIKNALFEMKRSRPTPDEKEEERLAEELKKIGEKLDELQQSQQEIMKDETLQEILKHLIKEQCSHSPADLSSHFDTIYSLLQQTKPFALNLKYTQNSDFPISSSKISSLQSLPDPDQPTTSVQTDSMPEHSLATLQTTFKTTMVDEVQNWLKDIREQAETVLAHCEEDEETAEGNEDLCDDVGEERKQSENDFDGGSKEGNKSESCTSEESEEEEGKVTEDADRFERSRKAGGIEFSGSDEEKKEEVDCDDLGEESLPEVKDPISINSNMPIDVKGEHSREASFTNNPNSIFDKNTEKFRKEDHHTDSGEYETKNVVEDPNNTSTVSQPNEESELEPPNEESESANKEQEEFREQQEQKNKFVLEEIEAVICDLKELETSKLKLQDYTEIDSLLNGNTASSNYNRNDEFKEPCVNEKDFVDLIKKSISS